ncbi:hypothetical protein SDC9_119703 [bioreactor metagenome]|uniref:Uncharacterized protein n=1 Tax=bioreactor metagenome TaxID=1076179 RepID=A0A645C6E2_9ZZZZ
MTHHCTRGERTVGVEGFNPVVILNAQLFGIGLADPDNGAAARKRQHQQVFTVGRVDPPFLVRRQEVEGFFREAVRRNLAHFTDAAGIDRRTIRHQTFTECSHPRVILVQLLATGQGTPWDQLVNVGIACVIGDMFAFKAGPGRTGDDFARLRLDIAKTNLFVFFVQRQMRMVASGHRPQRFPGFHRHLTVGFRRQGEDHLRGIQRGVNQRSAFCRAFAFGVVQLAEEIDFRLGIPRNAFPTVTKLVHKRTE